MEYQDEVIILSVDAASRKLALSQRLAMPDLAFPTAVQVSGGIISHPMVSSPWVDLCGTCLPGSGETSMSVHSSIWRDGSG